MNITLEQNQDQREVENLVRESFWNVYRPGCLEHYLIHELRKDENFVHELNFIMKEDEKIIGQSVCVKAKISDENTSHEVLTLGPISIHPAYARKGYGLKLLQYVIQEATKLGYKAILLEGNIDFYGKAGFVKASTKNIGYNGIRGIDTSFFLCKELVDGFLDSIEGDYYTPSVYIIDEDKVEAFDQQFPYKEKLVLEGQLF